MLPSPEDLWKDWENTHEDYHHVARINRTFNYNAPVSGAEWAQSPYEYENTTGPAEGPDELDPDLEVEEESWKLHQQAVDYQKHQEEELKNVRQTSEKLQQVPTKLSHTGMTLFQSLFTRDTLTKTIWSLSQRNQGGSTTVQY